jgi:tetratricopeptide (TPR) repeat protein
MREELAALRSGGASDLGAALEDAADALPPDAPDAAVVYVGDGLPTQGDPDAEAVRARLARRAAGVPRLAAVALGPLADRATLSALVHGSGPVVDVADRDDAARAAIALLGGLLEPAVSAVELDLGATVDRIYPRGAQTVAAHGSVMVVGRLRGKPPTTATLSFRRAGRIVSESRMVERLTTAKVGDVRRRWAKARVDDIVLRGESKETAADIAERARLLTPWTGWFVAGGATTVQSAPVAERSVDSTDTVLSVLYGLGPAAKRRGALLEPEQPRVVNDGEEDFATLVRASAGRTLDGAMAGVRRCRAARAALRPDTTGKLRVGLTIDGRGRPSRIVVRATEPVDDDPALDRCVQALIGSLSFFDSGTTSTVTVEHELLLPPPRDPRARRCSDTSVLPLPLRIGVWRERFRRAGPAEAYLRAKRGCELASFTDQRALLELILAQVPDGAMRLAIGRSLDDASETDAAAYLRKAAVERAQSPEELRAVRAALVGDEPLPGPTFKKQYLAAHDDEARLAVVRRFLGLSPHDPTFRRLLFSLLESLGKKDALAQEIEVARRDLFTDAALLADGASALLRIGRPDEARRAFGELIERAPCDPFAYAYTGDRLRDEGLFDEATSAYEMLGRLLPGDPSAALRLSLAHAGAGRLDVATRVLGRVATTGGRSGDGGLSELASVAASVLLADARAHATGSDLLALEQRALEVPLPDVAGVVLVRSPTLDVPVEPRIVRGQIDIVPDLSAPSLGLFAMRLERGEGEVRIHLRRPAALEPGRDTRVRVDVLALGEDSRVERLVEKEVVLPADGKDHELRWDGRVLL